MKKAENHRDNEQMYAVHVEKKSGENHPKNKRVWSDEVECSAQSRQWRDRRELEY